jgi:BirA family transcriptional regulator, biotin operon repressor / biotin---[acetyl-CoA-carboxylase] ligase
MALVWGAYPPCENRDMELPNSARLVPRLTVVQSAGSTNVELVREAGGPDAAAWPDLSVLVTGDQREGRGRLGRVWSAAPGSALAISVLLRPEPALPPDGLAWAPLLVGLAMSRAVTALGAAARLKWPNDVLVGGRKLSGILCELLPDGAVVAGAGLNLTMSEEELPVPTATSLALVGAPSDPDGALAAYLRELVPLYRALVAAGGDAEASGLRAQVTAACDTIGRAVRVELPGAAPLTGTAVDIDGHGQLVVEERGGALRPVAAGDVTHLRY